MGMKNMSSEDSQNIVALIIVTLSFVSVPLLIFFFVVMVYFNVNEVVQFYYTGAFVDALLAVLLAIGNIVLLFVIHRLVRWVRK